VRDNYLSTVSLETGVHGSFYSYRDVYLDLDPSYKDRLGRPLLRMTIDFHENELKQNAFLTDRFDEIIKAMGAKETLKEYRKGPYDITKYQTTSPLRRRHHGRRSEYQRDQSLPPELGRFEFVRYGRERLSTERRLQSDGHAGGACLLVGRRDQEPVPQESGTARPCLNASQR